MTNSRLIQELYNVEKLANASKLKRMIRNPIKYIHAIFFREIIYKKWKVEKEVTSKTFFDTKMHLLLPSSTDIYLTGGKSHDSEIRLAKFLIKNLATGDSFIDVGAHYGYFTLLSSKLVGNSGKVYSFEASPTTFKVLSKNTKDIKNIKTFNMAVAEESAELNFYEFPNLYSENNTLKIELFRSEIWFSDFKPIEITVKSIALDEFLNKEPVTPKIIKIDVEGAEYKVINGLSNYLSKNAPLVVMEYVSQERGNKEHQEAEKKLNSLGYVAHKIDHAGMLYHLEKTVDYLKEKKLESDNVVFVRQNL